jgi:hypothetical protein
MQVEKVELDMQPKKKGCVCLENALEVNVTCGSFGYRLAMMDAPARTRAAFNNFVPISFC